MSKSNTIEIPAPNVTQLEVTIQGLSPLLQNPPTKRVRETLAGGKSSGTSGKKEKLTPEEEVEEILQEMSLNGGGPPYGFNAVAIPHGMASAAYRLGDFSMAEIRAAVRVHAPEGRIPIDAPEPAMDSRLCSLSGRGSSKIANRPKFWPWSATFAVEFDRGVLSLEQVVRILQDMGRGIGLGAYRPENKGTFGTFEVEGVKVTGGVNA